MKIPVLVHNFDAINAFVDRELARVTLLTKAAHARRWRTWSGTAIRFACAIAIVAISLGLAVWLSALGPCHQPRHSHVAGLSPSIDDPPASIPENGGDLPLPGSGMGSFDRGGNPILSSGGDQDGRPTGRSESRGAVGSGVHRAEPGSSRRDTPEMARSVMPKRSPAEPSRGSDPSSDRDSDSSAGEAARSVRARSFARDDPPRNGMDDEPQPSRLSEETPSVRRKSTRDRIHKELVSNLEAEITAGEVQVGSTRAGIQVNLSEEVLFDEGSAQLDDVGREVLFRLAQQLLEITDDIEVQGHTDDQPISPELAGRYPSNWELAGARAGEVVRLLEGVGIESDRLTARSFGETRPIASNETEDGRRRNRRIELRILRGADG